MQKRRAELVHQFTAEVLEPNWTPTIDQKELDEANERLEADKNQFRWRWLHKVINLSGSITLHTKAHNATAA